MAILKIVKRLHDIAKRNFDAWITPSLQTERSAMLFHQQLGEDVRAARPDWAWCAQRGRHVIYFVIDRPGDRARAAR
ncbi:MAG TPA: hypothetical protein VJ840_01885 [Gemmatimonadaceae bacterium]|nr:hypothetical protein [Gemmatimonadaceae bacterium]